MDLEPLLFAFFFVPADPLRAVFFFARAIALGECWPARGVGALAGLFASARDEFALAGLLAVDPPLSVVAREPAVETWFAFGH